MTIVRFSEFLKNILHQITNILDIKSSDYSYDSDKLFNFKLAGRIDGITPIEALRGMQLKHKASIIQGLDELQDGNVRPWAWFLEKYIDNINYHILALALIKEIYFADQQEVFHLQKGETPGRVLPGQNEK